MFENLNPLLILCLFSLFIFSACGDDEPEPGPTYTIPTTYNFDNVSYDGQTQRLAMFSELKSYMKTSRTAGVGLDITRLSAMYANDAANANWQGTYDASKQLKSKTFSNVQSEFENLLGGLATASASTVPGTEGQAGVVESTDGSSTYLLGANGLDHAQLIEKGLMGACLFYQSVSVYFGDDRMNVDNVTVEPGEGTEMEHHWDEAFGYFGVLVNFPTDLDGLAFWGSYSNQRNDILGCNKLMMDGFLKGRAAISNDDLETRDEAITEVRNNWELITVGSALHYLNTTITGFDDMAKRGHLLSEGIGFVYALQFNPTKKITNTQINELLTLMGGAENFSGMDLYKVNLDDLKIAKDKLAGYYELDAGLF